MGYKTAFGSFSQMMQALKRISLICENFLNLFPASKKCKKYKKLIFKWLQKIKFSQIVPVFQRTISFIK